MAIGIESSGYDSVSRRGATCVVIDFFIEFPEAAGKSHRLHSGVGIFLLGITPAS